MSPGIRGNEISLCIDQIEHTHTYVLYILCVQYIQWKPVREKPRKVRTYVSTSFLKYRIAGKVGGKKFKFGKLCPK